MAKKKKKKSILISTKKRVPQPSPAERAFRLFRVISSEEEMLEPGEEAVPDEKRDEHDAIYDRITALLASSEENEDPHLISDIEAIIAEFPSLSHPRNWLLTTHQLKGDLDRALQLAEKLHAERPQYFFSRISLTQVHYELGNYKQAAEILWAQGYTPTKAYPDRKIFHGSEVYSWLLNSGKLLAVTGELKAARYCRGILANTERGASAVHEIDHLIQESVIREIAEKNGIELPSD